MIKETKRLIRFEDLSYDSKYSNQEGV
jgi:hypothetical protein